MLLASHSVQAATIKQRSVYSGTGSENWIIVKGQITAQDSIKFLAAMGDAKDVTTVWLESEGGVVDEGLAIAKIIKVLGLNTYVHDGKACSSICAVMFMSGKRKMLVSTATLGIHPAHDSKSLRKDLYANVSIAWYLGSLGYSEELVDLWIRTSPTQVVDLNDGNYKKLSLDFVTVEPIKIPLLDQLLQLD
jgi:hypothetical protein